MDVRYFDWPLRTTVGFYVCIVPHYELWFTLFSTYILVFINFVNTFHLLCLNTLSK